MSGLYSGNISATDEICQLEEHPSYPAQEGEPCFLYCSSFYPEPQVIEETLRTCSLWS